MTDTTKSRITVSVTLEQKNKAEAVAEEMGISLNSAIQLFMAQMIKDNGLPFKPTNHPSELEQALAEADSGNLKKYSISEFQQHIADLVNNPDD